MLTAAQVLAENNFGDTRSGGLAGPMGLFMIVVLAIATVLLIRNMNARLRRLPDRFPDQPADRSPGAAAGTVLDTTDQPTRDESSGTAPSRNDQGRSHHSAP